MYRVIGYLSALALCGCVTSTPYAQAPVEHSALSGAEVRRIVLAERTRVWKDPNSIVGAQIADPLQCRNYGMKAATNKLGTTCVCIELNARNSYGGYTGVKREVFAIAGNDLSSIDYGTMGPSADLCPNMKPFPELNGRELRSPTRPR